MRLVVAALMALALAVAAPAQPADPMAVAYEARTALLAPPVGAPPVIDGTVAAGEWDRACAATGFFDHATGELVVPGPVPFVAWDEGAIYVLVVTPVPTDRELAAQATERDGPVFRDDAVEVFLSPRAGEVVQYLVNSIGTLQDLRNNDATWNGAARAAGGLARPSDLPGLALDGERFWVAELAVPCADLGLERLAAGDALTVNIAGDRGRPWAVLAPTVGGPFNRPEQFLELRLLGPDEPFVQLTALGDVRSGRVSASGSLANPGAEPSDFTVEIDARKEGSRIAEGAYQEVIGVICSERARVTVAPGGREPFALDLTIDDSAIDRLAVRVTHADRVDLVRAGPVTVLPPLSVTAGNVPSRRYVVLSVDSWGLAASVEGDRLALAIAVLDGAGAVVLTRRETVPVGAAEVTLSYEGLPVGEHRCRVAASAEGRDLGEAMASFHHVAPPVWLTSTVYDDYGTLDRVPLPWMPVRARARELRVWGRSVRWDERSILPASITTQGRELLHAPMRLVITLDGEDHAVPLGAWEVTGHHRARVSLVARGTVAGIAARAEMFMEYDGFLWVDLRFDGAGPLHVEGLRIEAALDLEQTTLYHTFKRELTGWIGDEPIELAWLARRDEKIVNFYHWFGNEDGGLGFTYETLEHWRPATQENFATLIPGDGAMTYQVHLADEPVDLASRRFLLGIQATPIKPLPPDWHCMIGSRVKYDDWGVPARIPGNVDILSIWPPHNFVGLNSPYRVRRDRVLHDLEWAHERGIALVPVGCPQKISPLSQAFEDWALEMKALPESILNWEGIPHYQNCGRSYALRKWLFYGWAIENVQALGLDGIYYDGWMTGQIACCNPHHGCGWVDERGERQVTVPVLEGREFNQRMCLFLEDHVNCPIPPTAPERDGFPRYHYWIHSWQFVPSVMGFATEWLTGEFTAYPLEGPGMLTPEGSLGRCMGLGLLRTAGLSTNWGVPNMFYAPMWEHTEHHPEDRKTRMAYAWFLPHGVPLGLVHYMNQDTVVEVSRALMDFGARRASFTPGWRENAFVRVEQPIMPEVIVATWDHGPRGEVLIVISNLQVDVTERIRLRWLADWAPTLTDALTGETLALEDGGFEVELAPEDFVLVRAAAQ